MSIYTYKAQSTRVVDGDTIDFRVDLGFGVYMALRVRLRGVDTPELRSRNAAERAHAQEAAALVRAELDSRPDVTLKTYKDRTGKYGRYLADVIFSNGDSLVEMLIAEGMEKRDVYPEPAE